MPLRPLALCQLFRMASLSLRGTLRHRLVRLILGHWCPAEASTGADSNLCLLNKEAGKGGQVQDLGSFWWRGGRVWMWGGGWCQGVNSGLVGAKCFLHTMALGYISQLHVGFGRQEGKNIACFHQGSSVRTDRQTPPPRH